MKTIITGLDPGSSWLGFAVLEIDGKKYRANMGVLHVPSRAFWQCVDQITPSRGIVVMENYQQRPVGHQRFASGFTLQLIGAIKYACQKQDIPVLGVPTADPGQVNKLVVGRYLEHWLPAPRSKDWLHAWSAWRCIGRDLLTRDHKLLTNLLDDRIIPRMTIVDNARSGYKRDLIAPTALWRVP